MTILLSDNSIRKILPLPLGYQGENLANTLEFDYSEWAEEYGAGELSAYHKRPGDEQSYPVELTDSNNVASWTITNVDTSYAGYGEFQLIYSVNEVVKKSKVFRTTIMPSLDEGSEPVEPVIPVPSGDDGVFRVLISLDEGLNTFVLDKTYSEINSAISSGKYPYIMHDEENDRSFDLIFTVSMFDNLYHVQSSSMDFSSDSPDGQLVASMDPIK